MANPGRRLPKGPPELQHTRTLKEFAKVQGDFNWELANSVRGAPAPHRLLGHSDATDTPVARGALIKGGANKWSKLLIGAARTFIRSTGTDLAWALIEFLDLPVEARGWTDDGAVVRLTNSADDVVIGHTAKITGARHQIIGPNGATADTDILGFGGAVTIRALRANGTLSAPTSIAANDILGQYQWFGRDGLGYRQGAIINITVEQVIADDNFSVNMGLFTRPAGVGSLPVERIRISGAGLVAIGTINATSKLHVDGPIALAYASTAIDLTLDNTHSTVEVDTSGGNRIITLPTAVGIAGRAYTVKRATAGVNTLTVDGNGAETIDGALTVLLPNQWDVLRVQSNGATWLVI